MTSKGCSCGQGLDMPCPTHGRVNNKPYAMIFLGALAIGFIIYSIGKRVGYVEAMTPKDVAICDSSDALDGLSWRINLKEDLAKQGCGFNEAFPGKLLCEREVTIECEVP